MRAEALVASVVDRWGSEAWDSLVDSRQGRAFPIHHNPARDQQIAGRKATNSSACPASVKVGGASR